MYDTIVVHYGEIAIKGKNREVFEKQLMKNISKALKEFSPKVYRRYGRIIVKPKLWDHERIKNLLEKLPGIEYFSFAIRTKLSMEDIREKVLTLARSLKFETFRISATRSFKQFPHTSKEINEMLGEAVIETLGKRVNLSNPDVCFYVEVCEKEAFVYADKYKGVGGLPTGVSGCLVSLLSGGIDSPVASFLMMRRGCRIVLIHFFNQTITTQASLTKVKKIAKILSEIQQGITLYLVPFANAQRAIIQHVPSDYRMVEYRRIMMRVAEQIAKKEGAEGIVTGDSIGQVASQTLKNLKCIYEATNLPVFPPLIGMNKMEIVEWARRIGTYEISILPYQDCCSFMIARHPTTRASIKKLREFEQQFDVEKIVAECIEKAIKEVY